MDRWERLQRMIDMRRWRPSAPVGSETASAEAKSARKSNKTIDDVLAYIDRTDGSVRAAIAGAQITGRGLTLFTADSAALYELDRFVRLHQHSLMASCSNPPRRIAVKIGRGG